MHRIIGFIYGVLCYVVFFASFLYAVGFIGNFLVPKSLDSEVTVGLPVALLINGALLALFALQHSVMARPAFKRMWVEWVPPLLERSTYVLFSSVALILVFVFWQPASKNSTLTFTLQTGYHVREIHHGRAQVSCNFLAKMQRKFNKILFFACFMLRHRWRKRQGFSSSSGSIFSIWHKGERPA